MLAEVQFVVHALLFGFEVAFVVLVGGYDDRYDFVDLQSVTLQPYSLERIVVIRRMCLIPISRMMLAPTP